jgi:hypothetical protein
MADLPARKIGMLVMLPGVASQLLTCQLLRCDPFNV